MYINFERLNIKFAVVIFVSVVLYVWAALANIYFIDRIDIYAVPAGNNESVFSKFGYFLADSKIKILGEAEFGFTRPANCGFDTKLYSAMHKNDVFFSVDNTLGLLCVRDKGEFFLYKRVFALNSWQASLNEIQTFFVGGASQIYVVGPASQNIAVFQQGNGFSDFHVNLKPLEVINTGRLVYFIVGLLATAVCSGVICVFFPYIYSFLQGKAFLIVFVLTPLSFIYTALFPGILGMDLIANHAYNASTYNLYSTVYSLVMNLSSTIDYAFIAIISCVCFLISFLIHAVRTSTLSIAKQSFLALPIVGLLFVPAFTISIFGLQRIPFTNMVFLLFVSLLLFFLIYKSVNALCFSILMLTFLCLLRIEYLFFIVPLVYGAWSNAALIKEYARKLVCTLVICLVFIASIFYIESRNSNARDYRYMSVMLHAYVFPYITPTANLDKYFLTDGIHNKYQMQVSEDAYKQCLQYFLANVKENPYPYVSAAFSRFFRAVFMKETWGHSFNKFKLLEQDWSYHHFTAFSFFVAKPEICPFGRKFYDFFTEYIQGNKPFVKNGVLVAGLLIVFIFPFVFRANLSVLLLNCAMIAKLMFTILFSPAGYSLYYYDTVIYSGLVTYVLFLDWVRRCREA